MEISNIVRVQDKIALVCNYKTHKNAVLVQNQSKLTNLGNILSIAGNCMGV